MPEHHTLPQPAAAAETSLSPTLPPYNWANNPRAKCFYVTNLRTADALLAAHLSFASGAVGFDLEWPPTFRKGEREKAVSLVQIATEDAIFLFQISHMPAIPIQLQALLENPHIIKAGVNIKNDAQKLWRDLRIHILGCVELSYLARSVDNARWKGSYRALIGLARLTEAYLGGMLDKGKITRSNWAAHLTMQQQNYAANDAHAGYSLYALLKNMDSSSTDTTCYTFNVIRGSLYNINSAEGELLTAEEAIWDMSAAQLSPWQASNPAYDPGPPPEPKPPKPTTGDVPLKSFPRSARTNNTQERRRDLTRVPFLPPHT